MARVWRPWHGTPEPKPKAKAMPKAKEKAMPKAKEKARPKAKAKEEAGPFTLRSPPHTPSPQTPSPLRAPAAADEAETAPTTPQLPVLGVDVKHPDSP